MPEPMLEAGIEERMDADELMLNISTESLYEHTSPDLQLQKRLAKLILDLKYEHKMSQSALDTLLARFKSFFNEAFDLFGLSNVCINNCKT
jgi:hypothetical protein